MPTPETRRRKRFGWFVISSSVLVTLFVAYRIHNESCDLKTEQDVTKAVIHSDNYPLVIIDELGEIVQWNAGMERLTGIDADEAKRSGFAKMICDPVALEAHRRGLRHSLESNENDSKLKIVNCEIENLKTKMKIPVQISVRVIRAGGKPFAVARIDRQSEIVEFGKMNPADEQEQSAIK